MPIPSSITDLNTSEALNSPAGSDPVGGTLDNYLRAHAAIIKKQFVKGSDLSSAATLAVPAEGSYFNVGLVVSTISEFADNYDGRMVTLRFAAGITLAHSSALVLPDGVDIVTKDGDSARFVNEESGVWRCLEYSGGEKWRSRAIGEVFAIQTDLTGAEVPPNTSPQYRYIALTAADSYNDGALTDEEVSGSAPTISATAVIDYPTSPMHGQTVRLINTERRFLRAGSPGTLENSANLSHNHTASTNSTGNHTHSAGTGSAGGHDHEYARPVGSSAFDVGGLSAFTSVTPANTSTVGNHTHSVSINNAGAHSHAVTVNANGTTESRPRNMGITYFMRIQ